MALFYKPKRKGQSGMTLWSSMAYTPIGPSAVDYSAIFAIPTTNTLKKAERPEIEAELFKDLTTADKQDLNNQLNELMQLYSQAPAGTEAPLLARINNLRIQAQNARQSKVTVDALLKKAETKNGLQVGIMRNDGISTLVQDTQSGRYMEVPVSELPALPDKFKIVSVGEAARVMEYNVPRSQDNFFYDRTTGALGSLTGRALDYTSSANIEDAIKLIQGHIQSIGSSSRGNPLYWRDLPYSLTPIMQVGEGKLLYIMMKGKDTVKSNAYEAFKAGRLALDRLKSTTEYAPFAISVLERPETKRILSKVGQTELSREQVEKAMEKLNELSGTTFTYDPTRKYYAALDANGNEAKIPQYTVKDGKATITTKNNKIIYSDVTAFIAEDELDGQKKMLFDNILAEEVAKYMPVKQEHDRTLDISTLTIGDGPNGGGPATNDNYNYLRTFLLQGTVGDLYGTAKAYNSEKGTFTVQTGFTLKEGNMTPIRGRSTYHIVNGNGVSSQNASNEDFSPVFYNALVNGTGLPEGVTFVGASPAIRKNNMYQEQLTKYQAVPPETRIQRIADEFVKNATSEATQAGNPLNEDQIKQIEKQALEKATEYDAQVIQNLTNATNNLVDENFIAVTFQADADALKKLTTDYGFYLAPRGKGKQSYTILLPASPHATLETTTRDIHKHQEYSKEVRRQHEALKGIYGVAVTAPAQVSTQSNTPNPKTGAYILIHNLRGKVSEEEIKKQLAKAGWLEYYTEPAK